MAKYPTLEEARPLFQGYPKGIRPGFDVVPPTPSIDVSNEFSRDFKNVALEHPQILAMLQPRAPEPSEVQRYAPMLQHLAPILQRIPKDLRTRYRETKQYLVEIDSRIAAVESELAQRKEQRPRDLAAIDAWALEIATQEQRRTALIGVRLHSLAAFKDARAGVVAFVHAEATKERDEADATQQKALEAFNAAQAVLTEAGERLKFVNLVHVNIRDDGAEWRPLELAMEDV